MDFYNDLLWRQVAPGQYERSIDEAEQFYISMAKTYETTGHTYFAITAYSGLSITRSTELQDPDLDGRVEGAFRWAWKKLRHDHPTLAAPVEFDSGARRCKKVYKTLNNGSEVEAWMTETFKLVDTGQTGQDFANSDPPVGRYATLYLIMLPKEDKSGNQSYRCDIVFRSHHDLIDGIGTLTLLNNFLAHAASAFAATTKPLIEFGDEYKNLSPPFRIAAGIPLCPSAEQAAKLVDIKSANAAARAGFEILGLPFSSTLSQPGNSQRVAVHFSRIETAAIVTKPKALGATITQVFHAGIALAVRNLQPRRVQPRDARYISYSLVNLRHCCIPPYHKPRHAASVYHCVSATNLVVDLTIPSEISPTSGQSPQEFLSTLSQTRQFYQNAKIDADYLSIVPSLFSAVTPAYPRSPCEIPAPNPTPSVSLSSMGIVDRIVQLKHGPFEVLEPWVMGAEYSTGIGAFLGTWNGIMCLSAGYNEAFHTKVEALAFLESVKKIVLEGLEVDGWSDEPGLPIRSC